MNSKIFNIREFPLLQIYQLHTPTLRLSHMAESEKFIQMFHFIKLSGQISLCQALIAHTLPLTIL